jgi:hypothetical protein
VWRELAFDFGQCFRANRSAARFPQDLLRHLVARIQLERPAVVLDRPLIPAGTDQGLAKTVASNPGIRGELDLVLEPADGALDVASLQKRHSLLSDGLFVPGVEGSATLGTPKQQECSTA